MSRIAQSQRRLPGRTNERKSADTSSCLLWIRNPFICAIGALILITLFYVSEDFSQVGSSLDVAYLKGATSAFVLQQSSLGGVGFDAAKNAIEMRDWKAQTEESCQHMIADSDGRDSLATRTRKEEVERTAMERFRFPESVEGVLPAHHQPYQYCRNVFLDLGTNIGDSVGYFVDNALDACTPLWLKTYPKTRLDDKFPRPHLDVTDLGIVHKGKGNNPLYGMLQKQLNPEESTTIAPDSFCVYGMEGNPEFTERLQKLENFVMDTRPRPVQHLHIHTESVVTAVDGPTKLYLDKTSVKENFWGSSILSSQQDAVKSANELGGGEVFSADVTGISLSSLTKNTVLAYKPGATEAETKDGLLIIKMDVEGAEYQVLKEVAASGVLCDYIGKGNRVVMIVEFHNMSITDATERRREKSGSNEAKKTLEACGVEFGTLHAHWH